MTYRRYVNLFGKSYGFNIYSANRFHGRMIEIFTRRSLHVIEFRF